MTKTFRKSPHKHILRRGVNEKAGLSENYSDTNSQTMNVGHKVEIQHVLIKSDITGN